MPTEEKPRVVRNTRPLVCKTGRMCRVSINFQLVAITAPSLSDTAWLLTRQIGVHLTLGIMRFRIVVTSGDEVVFAEHSQIDRPVYYGAPPETGLWRVSIPKFESLVARELAPMSFGHSIEEFVFGFEIAELEEWGRWFKETRDYMSYRPKSKTFVSVGQLEWKEVKELPISAQLSKLGAALLSSIERIATAKRKPKDFDYAALAQAIRNFLPSCKSSVVQA